MMSPHEIFAGFVVVLCVWFVISQQVGRIKDQNFLVGVGIFYTICYAIAVPMLLDLSVLWQFMTGCLILVAIDHAIHNRIRILNEEVDNS